MRVVTIDGPVDLTPDFLQERSRLGLDGRDEMWEGVVHVVPSPPFRHQNLETRLAAALLPRGDRLGLKVVAEVGVYRPGRDDDWRVPDLVVVHPRHVLPRGVAGRAELVVEIRSPRDGTYQKIPFYGEVGCRELLVIDRDTCALELFALREGRLVPSNPAADGSFTLSALGVTVVAVPGRGLRVSWDGGSAVIVI